ncbi:MAG: UPF0146 family protein [Candidatus Baldrarchaeia archaeon]
MQLKNEEAIVEFIASLFPKPKKIIEVGVGKLPKIALKLAKKFPEAEIIVTDIDPQIIQQIEQQYPQIKTIKDDITKPNIKLYQNTDLIYSIRPPPELTPYLLKLAKKVGASLMIRPLSSETHEIQSTLEKAKIIRFKQATLILLHQEQDYTREEK